MAMTHQILNAAQHIPRILVLPFKMESSSFWYHTKMTILSHTKTEKEIGISFIFYCKNISTMWKGTSNQQQDDDTGNT